MFYNPETQTLISEGTPFTLNGVQYPQNWLNLSSIEEKSSAGIFEIVDVDEVKPAFNPLTEQLVQEPLVRVGNKMTRSWTVHSLPAEIVEYNTTQASKRFQEEVVQKVQQRLDSFARTRNYDGILSACTYSTSSVPKFASDGQYCVDARDMTWSTLYTLLAEVEAGTRTNVSTYEEVEVLLPELTWPV